MPSVLIKEDLSPDSILVLNDPWASAGYLTQAAADARYLKLAADNDPLTGTLDARTVLPSTASSGNWDLGSPTRRWRTAHSKTIVNGPVGVAPALTLTSASYGNSILNQGNFHNGQTSAHTMGGYLNTALTMATVSGAAAGSPASVYLGGQWNVVSAVVGNYYGATPGSVSVTGNGNLGGVVINKTGGTSSAAITTSGNFFSAYLGGSNTATATIGTSAGNFMHAVSYGSSGTGAFSMTSRGGFLHGFAGGAGGTVSNTSFGGSVLGFVNGASSLLTVGGDGALAAGYCAGSSATINSSGDGAVALGFANASRSITATAAGAFACGYTSTANITASAANSAQFGPGTNSLADSLKIGTAGLRLKGTTGAPGTPANGDIWLNNNYVYIRSNGVSCRVTNAVL